MSRPNILWICTDQQRYDTLGCYGNSVVHTPNIDRLAQNGVLFTRAYSQSPICTPSRASFMTGRYPSAHNVFRNGNDYFPPSEILVSKLFADAGYDCGLVGKLHLSRAAGRIEKRPDDGYRFFDWSHHPYPDWEQGHAYDDWLREEKGVDPKVLYRGLGRGNYYGPGVAAEFHQTTWCAETSIRFMREKRDCPWFLNINLFDPHPPFDPPPEFLERIDKDSVPPPVFDRNAAIRRRRLQGVAQQTPIPWDPATRKPLWTSETTEVSSKTSVPPVNPDFAAIKACYYAMVDLIDQQVGRILHALEESGQQNNTVVIFMSDHGEMLGDYGMLYKGCQFFDCMVRVPLILSCPGLPQKSLRSSALVELVDLAPTLLELAGQKVPDYMQGKSLQGLLRGETDTHKSCVISQYYDTLNLPLKTHGSMCFDGRYKSIVYHDVCTGELYDLESDPSELYDLWEEPAAAGLRGNLLQRHLDTMMATIWAGPLRTGPY